MFRKTVHPLDLLLAVLAAATPGAAIFYWLASRGGCRSISCPGLRTCSTAAAVMLAVIGGMVAFAVWFFSPRR